MLLSEEELSGIVVLIVVIEIFLESGNCRRLGEQQCYLGFVCDYQGCAMMEAVFVCVVPIQTWTQGLKFIKEKNCNNYGLSGLCLVEYRYIFDMVLNNKTISINSLLKSWVPGKEVGRRKVWHGSNLG